MHSLYRNPNCRRTAGLLSLLLLAAPVSAQNTESGPDPQTDVPEDVVFLDTFEVSTGAAGSVKHSVFETSYAITGMDSAKLDVVNPSSAADLFNEVPGFYAEDTGGEVSNNLYVRGLPLAGGYKFTPLMQDGLPMFEEPEIGFMNADVFHRIDLFTERAEFVRGGPAAIFHSNALGGAINFRNRRGTETFENKIRLTWGDYGYLKTEGYSSGPLSDSISYAFGGYYRVGDGVRDPGYQADDGGQLKFALTYRNDDKSTEASIYYYKIDDRTVFYLPIPVTDPKNPKAIAGVDVHYGTLLGPDMQNVTLKTGNSRRAVDLSDGIHSNFDTVGFEINRDLGNGWSLENRFRYMSGRNDFHGIFPSFSPETAWSYLYGDLGGARTPTLARMQAESRQFDGSSITQLGLVYVNDETGTIINVDPNNPASSPNLNGNGLVGQQGWWTGNITARNMINEFRVNKSLDKWDFSTGLYYSSYYSRSQDSFNDFLSDIRDHSRMLDVVGLDSSGNPVGYLTENGFVRQSSFGIDAKDWYDKLALFGNATWDMSDKLRLDFGLRYETLDIDTQRANWESVDLGNTTTLADDAAQTTTGTWVERNRSQSDLGYTLGANYEVSDSVSFYGRYSDTFRLARGEAFWFVDNSVPDPEVQSVKQFEFGAKYRRGGLSLFVTPFYNKFDNLAFFSQVQNPQTLEVTQETFYAGTEAFGVELEANWYVSRNFSINAMSTLQKATYKDFTVREYTFNQGVPTVTEIDYSDNEVTRIPKFIIQVRPTFYFNIGKARAQTYVSGRYVGDRWNDTSNENKLYSYIDTEAGIIVDFNEHVSMQLHVTNLTNAAGLTEGSVEQLGIRTSANEDVIWGRPQLGRVVRVSATYSF